MTDCPVPEGYDPRRVRPSIEAEFEKLGYSGPVSITAWADHNQTPHHLLQGLSSTGVSVAHSTLARISSNMEDLFARPSKMSILVTSAEWLWDSLLAVSDTRGQLLRKCSGSACESTGTFSCKTCFGISFKHLDHFREHLLREDHAQEEASIYSFRRLCRREQEQAVKDHYLPKRKRLRKAAPRTGFRPFHNHLSLTST